MLCQLAATGLEWLFIFARFVKPNCCVGLLQFLFGVLVLVYLLCLLDSDKLNAFVDRAS
jgi:hypothetical protein